MLHLVCVDSAKHNFGINSKEVDDTLKILDDMIGEIMNVCSDDYTIILFSDHGQFDVNKIVYTNVFLQQHGLLSFENQTYDAYIQYMGGSSIIRYKNEEALEKTLKLLDENKEMLGIEDIYTRDTLDKLNVAEDIEYIIESKPGYYMREEKYESVIKDLMEENIKYATHGYSPLKANYNCVFFALGDSVAKGEEIEQMEVVDIAPTVAKIMELDEFICDGKVLDKVFK